MLRFLYRREATLSAFQIISLIINRRRIDINSKLKYVEVAKKLAGTASPHDFSGAMLRLHYRIHNLLKWDGLPHELEQQIGRDEEEGFESFVKSVIPDYLNFFGIEETFDLFSRPIGKGAGRTSDLVKTPTEESTSAGDIAMTSSISGLAT